MKVNKFVFYFLYFIFNTLSPKLNAQVWDEWVGDSIINIYGVGPGRVYTMLKEGDSLIVGGIFTHIGQNAIYCNAIWNGNVWKPLASTSTSCNFSIQEFQRWRGKLLAMGNISNCSGIENICKLENNNWLPLHYDQPNGDVKTAIEYNNLLVIGGYFTDIGTDYSQYTSNIGMFDGTNWIYVGWPGRPRDFSIYNGHLYAACRDWGVQKWEGGTSWSMAFDGVWGNVECSLVDTFNNFMYIGGSFLSVGGGSYGVNNLVTWQVAMWDGEKWALFGTELYGDVIAIELYRGELYAAGYFNVNEVTQDTIRYIARWDDEHWRPLGKGANGLICALEVFNDSLFVGGYMDTIDNKKCYGLAKWYMPPDTQCKYMQPRALTLNDTVYLTQGSATAQFYSNNAYVDTWHWDFGDGQTANIKDPLHVYTDTGTYPVSVTVSHNGCTKTASKNIVVELGTSINEVDNFNYAFKVFPNPTSGSVMVACTLPQGQNGEICLYNPYGSKIYTAPVSSGTNAIQINPETLPSGATLCALYINGKQILLEKIIKKS